MFCQWLGALAVANAGVAVTWISRSQGFSCRDRNHRTPSRMLEQTDGRISVVEEAEVEVEVEGVVVDLRKMPDL